MAPAVVRGLVHLLLTGISLKLISSGIVMGSDRYLDFLQLQSLLFQGLAQAGKMLADHLLGLGRLGNDMSLDRILRYLDFHP